MSICNSYEERSSGASLRSPQMRKEALRTVLTRAESLSEETVDDSTINALEQCMEETDTINSETDIQEKLNNQEEVLLDSRMMSISSHILKKCTRTLTKSICSYNYVEFAKNIIQHVCQLPDIETDTPDWSLLDSEIAKYFTVTPQYSALLGTLTPLEKKEVVRKKGTRDLQAPIKRPENIVAADKEQEGPQQTVLVKEVITKYFKTHGKPVNFFTLVLHPTDFGKTIENILHISFLARDGNVLITQDNSGSLLIQPKTKELAAQMKARNGSNTQNIIHLTMQQWKTLVKAYNIRKPMLSFGDT